MVFKKFDEQQVYQLSCKSVSGAELEVGDVISYHPALKTVVHITTKADAMSAIADQQELYLIAQGDAVTEKTGTEYKNYNIGRLVNLEAGVEKIVAAYRITMIDNVEGWED